MRLFSESQKLENGAMGMLNIHQQREQTDSDTAGNNHEAAEKEQTGIRSTLIQLLLRPEDRWSLGIWGQPR